MIDKKIIICFFVATLGFLFLPAKALAATYYVSTTGNDTNNGSQGLPWKTIQKAANTVIAGDTVTVASGSDFPKISIRFSCVTN